MKELKRCTLMSMEELRDELDALVMTLGAPRKIAVLAEAVSRLITGTRTPQADDTTKEMENGNPSTR